MSMMHSALTPLMEASAKWRARVVDDGAMAPVRLGFVSSARIQFDLIYSHAFSFMRQKVR